MVRSGLSEETDARPPLRTHSADRRRMRMIRLLNPNDRADAGPRLRHDDTPCSVSSRGGRFVPRRGQNASRVSQVLGDPAGNPGPGRHSNPRQCFCLAYCREKVALATSALTRMSRTRCDRVPAPPAEEERMADSWSIMPPAEETIGAACHASASQARMSSTKRMSTDGLSRAGMKPQLCQ